jgi:hypothetical protein
MADMSTSALDTQYGTSSDVDPLGSPQLVTKAECFQSGTPDTMGGGTQRIDIESFRWRVVGRMPMRAARDIIVSSFFSPAWW